MTSLLQRRDASVVERIYAPDYIQHYPGIPQGRDALRALVADLSKEVYYEPGLIVAEGDLVAIHGRIRASALRPRVSPCRGCQWDRPAWKWAARPMPMR